MNKNVIIVSFHHSIKKCFFKKYSNLHYLILIINDVMNSILRVNLGNEDYNCMIMYKAQNFEINLYAIKIKPIGMCIDISIVNSKPIESPFDYAFPQQRSSFLRTVHLVIILPRYVGYNKGWEYV